MKIFKQIIYFGLCSFLALLFIVFLNYDIFFTVLGWHFIGLIIIRILKLNAMKKLNPYFHGNLTKYRYQKRDDLEGYKTLLKRIEIVGIISAVFLFIMGLLDLFVL